MFWIKSNCGSKTKLLFLFFLLICTASKAQNNLGHQVGKRIISGYITDGTTGESLWGATVGVVNQGASVITNRYGFYSITLLSDSADLFVSYSGYKLCVMKYVLTGDGRMDVKMEPSSKELQTITVTANSTGIQNRVQMSNIELPMRIIKSLPFILGEADIMKALQLLPGVQAGGEGTGGLYVRGGGSDQNLILLDGVPMYNINHLFGLFSIFNPDAISSVEIYKGGFPARYGGRLSSVIEIKMKEGNRNEFRGEGSVGVISSKLTLEGPVGKKKKSSFLLSGRRTYLDLVTKPFMKNANPKLGYYFYDLNGKVNFELGKKNHLYISVYFGKDKFSSLKKTQNDLFERVSKSEIAWGSAVAVARWNHEFGKKIYGNFTAYFSSYKFTESGKSNDVLISHTPPDTSYVNLKYVYYSSIKDISARYDIDYFVNSSHFIRVGFSHTFHSFKPGITQANRYFKGGTGTQDLHAYLDNGKYNGGESDVYVEDDIKFSRKLRANAGLHYTSYVLKNDSSFKSLQPRISIRYLLNNKISLKASYVKMNQYINLLTNNGVGFPTDLWVPATKVDPPQIASQFSFGIALQQKKGLEFSIEGYYKKMKNVIAYAEAAQFLYTTDKWQENILIGKGWSYGGELLVQKKVGRTTGLIGYTLSWSLRQFDEINMGKKFSYKYDRRHDFKVAIVHKLNDRLEFSGDWIFQTGNVVTLPVMVGSDDLQFEDDIYTEVNNVRLPVYHRLDIGIKLVKRKKKYERAWVFGLYNAYARKNVFYVYREKVERPNDSPFKAVTLFPIIPSVSYQFNF